MVEKVPSLSNNPVNWETGDLPVGIRICVPWEKCNLWKRERDTSQTVCSVVECVYYGPLQLMRGSHCMKTEAQDREEMHMFFISVNL